MTARWWAMLVIILLLGTGVVVATPPQKVVYSPPQQQATYQPAYGPAFSSSDDLLKQNLETNKLILAEIQGLRKDIREGLKLGQGATQDGALGIIANRCLKCHQDGKAQTDGGEFILVEKDSTLAELSLAEKRRIIKRISSGKDPMPPSGKLAEAEVKTLTEFFAPKEELKR